jgi:hypothetical protein
MVLYPARHHPRVQEGWQPVVVLKFCILWGGCLSLNSVFLCVIWQLSLWMTVLWLAVLLQSRNT